MQLPDEYALTRPKFALLFGPGQQTDGGDENILRRMGAVDDVRRVARWARHIHSTPAGLPVSAYVKRPCTGSL